MGESSQGMECFYYIIGNKCDLDDEREVSTEEGQEWVESYKEELDEDEEIEDEVDESLDLGEESGVIDWDQMRGPGPGISSVGVKADTTAGQDVREKARFILEQQAGDDPC